GLLFAIPKDVELRTTARPLQVSAELRLQGPGAQTVLPPSRHASGRRYRWVEGHGPGEIDPASAPDWIIRLMSAGSRGGNSKSRRRGGREDHGERISEGARNTTLASLAGAMRRRGMGEAAIRAALREENSRRCDPPMDVAEVDAIAGSMVRYPPGE